MQSVPAQLTRDQWHTEGRRWSLVVHVQSVMGMMLTM